MVPEINSRFHTHLIHCE